MIFSRSCVYKCKLGQVGLFLMSKHVLISKTFKIFEGSNFENSAVFE